jgi:hypothetical protein
MFLPVPEPTTVPAVKLHLGITDAADDDALAPVVGAVCYLIRHLPVASTALAATVEAAVWPADVQHGATLLAARLWRRRNSPEGVAAFGADGPVYVQRNDPDVAMMLALGDWARPSVG